mgnify:CR=1 FL=1
MTNTKLLKMMYTKAYQKLLLRRQRVLMLSWHEKLNQIDSEECWKLKLKVGLLRNEVFSQMVFASFGLLHNSISRSLIYLYIYIGSRILFMWLHYGFPNIAICFENPSITTNFVECACDESHILKGRCEKKVIPLEDKKSKQCEKCQLYGA